jgi:hypothetical protein
LCFYYTFSNLILDDAVFADVRGNRVYYQVAFEKGSLRCEFKVNSGSSTWYPFANDPDYYDGYAECGLLKGNPDYTIKLTLNGNIYYTNENDAIQKGTFSNQGIVDMLDFMSITLC